MRLAKGALLDTAGAPVTVGRNGHVVIAYDECRVALDTALEFDPHAGVQAVVRRCSPMVTTTGPITLPHTLRLTNAGQFAEGDRVTLLRSDDSVTGTFARILDARYPYGPFHWEIRYTATSVYAVLVANT